MRAMLLLLLSSALIIGCKHPKSSSGPRDTAKAAPEKKATKAPARDSSAPARVTPINESAGRVASVNSSLRFVVIDFGANAAPPADQRLSLYRAGQKVGEVKISSQARNSIVAADITAGEAKVGDDVRTEP